MHSDDVHEEASVVHHIRNREHVTRKTAQMLVDLNSRNSLVDFDRLSAVHHRHTSVVLAGLCPGNLVRLEAFRAPGTAGCGIPGVHIRESLLGSDYLVPGMGHKHNHACCFVVCVYIHHMIIQYLINKPYKR